jgi:DNA-binding CsgD family transcriptional regulator
LPQSGSIPLRVAALITVQPSAKTFAAARMVDIDEHAPGDSSDRGSSEHLRASSLHEVGVATRAFGAQIGYEKFLACFYVPTARADDSLVVLNGYPAKWMPIYRQRHYLDIDPILTRQWRTFEPFEWSDLDPQEFHPQAYELFTEAMRVGIVSGFSLHLLGRSGAHLSLNFATGRQTSLGPRRSEVFGASLLFGTKILAAAVNLIERDVTTFLRRLSPRQLEALQWVARGLSMREAGKRMGVGAPTVEYLMRQAQANLGAGSREEAILHAAQSGLVSRHVEHRVVGRDD